MNFSVVLRDKPEPKRHFHFDIPADTRVTSLGGWPFTVHSGEFDWVNENHNVVETARQSPNPTARRGTDRKTLPPR